jgi:hypothetical protein
MNLSTVLSMILFVQPHAFIRRKFRSQTSDNMDRSKSRGGKSQRGEKADVGRVREETSRREKIREEKE